MTGIGSASIRAALAGVAILAVGACATLSDKHGYAPDDEVLSDVMVGLDTKETVARLVGRPGTAGIVDDRGWYYVRSEYERFLWRAPVEVDREVVVISFAEDTRVENIERFGLGDGQVVVLSRRVTDDNIRGVGFLRQLFSNLGNFNAGQFLNDQ